MSGERGSMSLDSGCPTTFVVASVTAIGVSSSSSVDEAVATIVVSNGAKPSARARSR
jgi:hypothetical protein